MKAETETGELIPVFLNPNITEIEYGELIESLDKYKAYYDLQVQVLYTNAPKEFIARIARKNKSVQSY